MLSLLGMCREYCSLYLKSIDGRLSELDSIRFDIIKKEISNTEDRFGLTFVCDLVSRVRVSFVASGYTIVSYSLEYPDSIRSVLDKLFKQRWIDNGNRFISTVIHQSSDSVLCYTASLVNSGSCVCISGCDLSLLSDVIPEYLLIRLFLGNRCGKIIIKIVDCGKSEYMLSELEIC